MTGRVAEEPSGAADRFVPPPVALPPRPGRQPGRQVDALTWDEVRVMGVVNVTPDSFSDGTVDPAAAVALGVALWQAGADILDVGGEATNPRARGVAAEVEIARVVPVLTGLAAATGAVLSIDTTKAAVAAAAVAAGADLVNDVSGGAFDPELTRVTDELGAGYVCGHLRGRTLAEVFAREGDLSWTEVADDLGRALDALPPGLRERTVVDPGLGFGKGAGPANLALCARAGDLARATGRPVLVGPSRKRFVARLAGPAVDAGTVGACLAAVAAGAHALRVHDVSLLRPALTVYTAIGRTR